MLKLCRNNNHLVSSISACGDLPDALARTLNQFVSSAKGRIESVAAYHGCRVLDERSYREDGIRRLEAARLISWCKTFFEFNERIDEIVLDLQIGYLSHGESAVFCMRSMEAERKNGCCHHEGSELVRHIARQLGPIAEDKYYSAGRSCFLEVCTPMDWFERNSQGTIDNLLRDLFVHWLWIELSLEWRGDPRRGGIVFSADIPAEYLKTFHYLE